MNTLEAQSTAESPRPTLPPLSTGTQIAVQSALGCIEQMRVYHGLATARLHFANHVGNLAPRTAQIFAHLESIEASLLRVHEQVTALSQGKEIPE